VRKGDELLFRKPKDNVEALIKNQILKRRIEDSDNKKEMTFERLKSLVPWELIVGLLAAVIIYFMFGWKRIIEAMLSYIMATTLVAALITAIMAKYYPKKKK
jgi:hypothetical protein